MKNINYDYIIQNINTLDTPALVVFPEKVKENIAQLIRMIDGDVSRLRPHIKTHKSPDVVQLLLAAGITKFKCATIAEAEILGMYQAPDVLLAYQPSAAKLGRFVQLIQQYPATRFSCLVDNWAAAQAQSVAFFSKNWQISVFIDLNIGQNRTGIAPEAAFDLYEKCLTLTGIQVVGLHAYDGHIYQADLQTRKEVCEAAFERVKALEAEISSKILRGGKKLLIVAGGSPTFPFHAQRLNVECSPGTFVYWDKGYSDICAEQSFTPAALLVTRVVSLPDDTKICVDLGHKSVAAENELTKRVHFLNAELAPLSQSEEHLVLEAGAEHNFQIGDILYGVPQHICPTVALYERVFIVENNHINGEWQTIARDRKISV
jgi:D-threonine aldolase